MAEPRSILFTVQTHTVWGGMEWFVDLLARELQSRGWRVFAGLAKGRRFSDPARYLAGHPHLRGIVMDGTAQTESSRVRAVEHAISRSRADIVMPVGIGATLTAVRRLKATSKRPPRLVLPVFSMFPDWLVNIIDAADIADHVVSNSRLTERFLARSIPPMRLHHIPQGTRRATTRRTESDGPLRVGFVGRLEESSKRILDLARVVRELERRGTLELFTFDVYGDGPDRDRLTEALGGVPRVRLHGFVPTPRLYEVAYPNLDVVLLFSATEGSPNAVYEAMQNAIVPVISRYLALASEGIVRDGENALSFAVGDTSAAVGHLERLAKERSLVQRLALRARETVERWTVDDMNRAWCKLFETAAAMEPLRSSRSPEVAHAGRLDRLIGSVLADNVRRLRPAKPDRDGWEEWPGTVSVSGARVTETARELEAQDRSPVK